MASARITPVSAIVRSRRRLLRFHSWISGFGGGNASTVPAAMS